jgi:hypothetical protein
VKIFGISFGGRVEEKQPVWPAGCEEMTAEEFVRECQREAEAFNDAPASPETYPSELPWFLSRLKGK